MDHRNGGPADIQWQLNQRFKDKQDLYRYMNNNMVSRQPP